MNIAEAIQYLYPDASPLRDFEVADQSNGKGPYISKWEILLKNGDKTQRPTKEQLAAAYAASQLPTADEVSAEAQRRILDALPYWKQLNYLSRMLELQSKEKASWSNGEQAEAAAIEAKWGWLKSVRAASDGLKKALPTDYANGRHWPAR